MYRLTHKTNKTLTTILKRNYSNNVNPPKHFTRLQYVVPNTTGALWNALQCFKDRGISLSGIQSKGAGKHGATIVTDFNTPNDLNGLVDQLKSLTHHVTILKNYEVPWFPRKISDIDSISANCKMAGTDLNSDHPGFKDPVYRKRREEIADIAGSYKSGTKIPKVNYSEEETKTWGTMFKTLTALYPTHSCYQYLDNFVKLVENCGYRENNVPQLADVSDYLQSQTGFTIRPVSGLLESRDFLASLAFRVFCSTQYLRHHTKPLYTPEPDIVHELLGHVPMFLDPEFAQFSQNIGLASLGASDETIQHLSTCYWFTVEFGLILQNGQRRAYGAGLLSSFGELQHCVQPGLDIRTFDPKTTSIQEYPITTYQPVYYICSSFKEMMEQMNRYFSQGGKEFSVRYNNYTQEVEVEY